MPASNDLLALVNDFVARLESAIRADLVARLTEGLPNGTGPAAKNPSEGSARRGRRLVPSPAAKRTRRLQGQYLGLLRGLTPAQRSDVKRTAREKGVAAAVKLGRRLRGRSA
jgi:hypothetical protein